MFTWDASNINRIPVECHPITLTVVPAREKHDEWTPGDSVMTVHRNALVLQYLQGLLLAIFTNWIPIFVLLLLLTVHKVISVFPSTCRPWPNLVDKTTQKGKVFHDFVVHPHPNLGLVVGGCYASVAETQEWNCLLSVSIRRHLQLQFSNFK